MLSCMDEMQQRYTQARSGAGKERWKPGRSGPSFSGFSGKRLSLDESAGRAVLPQARAAERADAGLASPASPCRATCRSDAERAGAVFWRIAALYLACAPSDGVNP